MVNAEQPLASPLTDRILRMPELVEVTGLSAASIYRLIAKELFPRPVALGPQARGWKASAVQGWIESLEPAEGLTQPGRPVDQVGRYVARDGEGGPPGHTATSEREAQG